ncbi:hypothetical protein [Caulobacter endophyticus]|uniref:hypothetical protein n=1 Tax=Caulobacter endophyticus TaxID=2172652 RepID=UPI001E61B697|nr:hypothetical protein [Caulobacter endophyticus]
MLHLLVGGGLVPDPVSTAASGTEGGGLERQQVGRFRIKEGWRWERGERAARLPQARIG